MAGNWIKFEKCTFDKPEVFAIAERLNIEPVAVVGRLLRIWSWFDEHTTDGNAVGVTISLLDWQAGVAGFAEAMMAVGWLIKEDGNISLSHFDRHNGETAKKRALTAKRAAAFKSKSKASANAPTNATSVNSALPREDKRREEYIQKEEGEEERGRAREEELLKVEVVHSEPIWQKDHGWQGISAEEKQRWKLAYPACDIERQLLQMDIWLRANPAESHKTQWMKFITGWLKREQDKGGDVRADRRTNPMTARKGGNPFQMKKSDHSQGF